MNFAQVWKPMILCGNSAKPECDFYDLIEVAKAVISNLIVISAVLALVAFVWIGFKLMTSQGNPGAMEEAKKMAWKVLWGFIWVLGAWIVVYTISSVLLNDGFSLIIGNP